MRVLLQFALTALASLLLGADEKSTRLEKTMQRPLPSSLGSCELWSPAGRRCEAAMAAAAGASPQLLPPTPVCPCSLGSPNSVGFWGYTLHPCTVQRASSPPKALEVPPLLGGGLSVSFWPN